MQNNSQTVSNDLQKIPSSTNALPETLIGQMLYPWAFVSPVRKWGSPHKDKLGIDRVMDDLRETLVPNGKDSDFLVGPDLTECKSVLRKLIWLQSRIQLHISHCFSRCASASASATIADLKELNKGMRMVKDKP